MMEPVIRALRETECFALIAVSRNEWEKFKAGSPKAVYDLYRQLKEYFDMSVESRQNYSQDMIQRLTDIHRLVGRAKEIVEHNEVSEFKMIARELEIKFGQGV